MALGQHEGRMDKLDIELEERASLIGLLIYYLRLERIKGKLLHHSML